MLKNGCKLPTKPEDLEKFAKRRRQTEIKIERLQEQLNDRLPQGRDLTKDKWLQTLITAANTIPEDEKVTRSWQDFLLTKPKSLILISVAFGLNTLATVAVVDGIKGEAIAYRSAKQLLGKNYRLLNRQRQ